MTAPQALAEHLPGPRPLARATGYDPSYLGRLLSGQCDCTTGRLVTLLGKLRAAGHDLRVTATADGWTVETQRTEGMPAPGPTGNHRRTADV